MSNTDAVETARACLAQINPAALDYNEWLSVGMAAKDAGLSFEEWDRWSAADAARYVAKEMPAKWASFRGRSTHPVGVGTLVKLCREQGGNVGLASFAGDTGGELAWDASIGAAGAGLREQAPRAALQVVRQEWLDVQPLPPAPDAATYDGRRDFAAYIRTLFNSEERVGIVAEAWEQDAPDGAKRWLPKRGVWDRTAGELLEAAAKERDLGAVIGDWQPEAGAWIRFNPLNGEGCADDNVTAFRYALVESDDISLERQHAIYRKLELPIAALVHSGGKSLHAIVRVDAPTFAEYQKRVDFLYDVAKKNGLVVDRKNRNPSRLSRLPGAVRNGRPQWLVATNVGKPTWAEWADWIAAQNDDLPDVETLSAFRGNLPPLDAAVIDGVLRRGHKMLLAGPSKAGKSYLLMQLLIAIAEGRSWLGWPCAKGRVLYVNLELARASALHRLYDLYDALGIEPEHDDDIDIWNLRGKACPMQDLVPRLIRRAAKRQYSVIVLDPIYKVMTGDECAASEMAAFCNQFDKVCAELGVAFVYCHHHSKGGQGQKRASDRASGSGVFARDPDALVDLIELDVDEARRKQIANRWEADAVAGLLDARQEGWRDVVPQDEQVVAEKLAAYANVVCGIEAVSAVRAPAAKAAESASGWRVEGILREFAPFRPRRLFFHHPYHVVDTWGLLDDALAEGELPPKRNRADAIAERQRDDAATTRNAVAFAPRQEDGTVRLDDVAEYLSVSVRQARDRVKAAGFAVSRGAIKVDAAGGPTDAGNDAGETPENNGAGE